MIHKAFVFFAELAVFRSICRNADDLFRVSVGEDVECILDKDAYSRLVSRLLAS